MILGVLFRHTARTLLVIALGLMMSTGEVQAQVNAGTFLPHVLSATDSLTKDLTPVADSLAKQLAPKASQVVEEYRPLADSLAKELAPMADSLVKAFSTEAASLLSEYDDSTTSAKTLKHAKQQKRDWSTWRPDPKRALWLALVIPGGGQIYNRKYWKLPLVYGGFVGCAYAMTWNNTMYKDYSQAYLDLMDDDPGTRSYEQFMHLGRKIDSTNEQHFKDLFKSRKDRYRRWRDLSFFVMVGIYALSVIDAYVDSELSVFDISKDLSLKVEPAVIGAPEPSAGASYLKGAANRNPLYATSVGLNCSISF